MPEFLEKKLKAEYGDNPHAIYGTLNKIGAMKGSKETPKGAAMQAKHEAKVKPHVGFRSVVKATGTLSSAERKEIPKSKFGLPGARKYPMPDASHAANAKARATQQVKAGNLSPASKAKIDAKANAVLGKSKPKESVKNPFSKMKKRA